MARTGSFIETGVKNESETHLEERIESVDCRGPKPGALGDYREPNLPSARQEHPLDSPNRPVFALGLRRTADNVRGSSRV